MLPCSQRTLILVLEHMGNFGVRLPPGCSRYGITPTERTNKVLTLFVRSNIKPLCHRMTGVSKIYAANHGYVICS